MSFDLGAARRRRGDYSPKELIITDADGEVEAKYELVSDVPVEFFDHGSEGRLAKALSLLFVHQSDADSFLARYKPGFDDLTAILQGVYPENSFGDKLGEALASGGSSTSE
jgi:hypothetical protein